MKRLSRPEAHRILNLMESVEGQPSKGKLLGTVGGMVIKELKYRKFRFYFITDGFILKMMDEEAMADILLRFVRMSDKTYQKEVIEEIKEVLRKVGPMGFS